MRDKDELQIGRTCQLKVNRQVEFGFYLDGGEQYGEVLLPNGEIRPDIDVHIGEPLEVFLYLDTQERIVATTHMPLAQVGDFAYLEVAWVNNFGAFLHWGPLKDLFVPFREQKMKMMKEFRDNHVLSKPECVDCWAKFFCSGGCHANNESYAGDMHKPYHLTCEIQKKRIECAMMIQAYNKMNKPKVMKQPGLEKMRY